MITIPKRLGSLPILITLAALVFIIPGCVTIDQSEQLDTRRELNALNAMYKGVMKKVERIDINTDSMLEDIERTTTGFASLEVETRSALAENNAELESFREEFGFVRGSIEESNHTRGELREEIRDITRGIDDITLRLARLENTAKLAEDGGGTSRETDKLVTSLKAKTSELESGAGDLKAKIDNLNKLNASLERRISKLEGKSPRKMKIATKKTDKKPGELYELGHQHALKKNYSKAITQLKEFLSVYPKHKLADRAQYWLARSYYGKDDWEIAVLEFNKVIKKYPKSERRGPAIYMQGLSFYRLGSNKEARVIFERVINKFPNTKEASEAKKRLKKMDLQDQ